MPGASQRGSGSSTPASGGPKKRGRPFRFSDAQTAEFRKQVEGGKSATALAKELKESLPTLYDTLKRAEWKGRKNEAFPMAPP
jgi:transposase